MKKNLKRKLILVVLAVLLCAGSTMVYGETGIDNQSGKTPVYHGTAATLSDGEKLTLTDFDATLDNKSMVFQCNLDNLATGLIRMGHGKTANDGHYLEVTADTLRVCYNPPVIPVVEFKHGLDIEKELKVQIVKRNGTTTISLETPSGTFDGRTYWSGRNGDIFCEVEGLTITNVDCRWYAENLDSDIWLFGDSYFNTGSDAGWLYHLFQDGYNKVFAAGYGGMQTQYGLELFRRYLAFDTPEYVVWCLGMNNGDGVDGSLNEDWLAATTEFLALCKEHGVKPILATIPNVRPISNIAKNQWVRTSGYRYIDFNGAVVADDLNGQWKGDWLQPDLIHPNGAGAKALYEQVLIDFPEIVGEQLASCRHSQPGMGDIVLETPATITEDGVRVYTCLYCGETIHTETISKIGTVALGISETVYNGKVRSPKIIVKDAAGNVLQKGVDYTVTVPAGRKSVGKYTYTVQFQGNYAGSEELLMTIKPRGATLQKPVAAGKNAVVVKWAKAKNVTPTGYQVMVATNQKFTAGKKTVTVKDTAKKSVKIGKLKAKKTYYVKIRTYKTVNGKKIYSNWSKVKSVRTK